MALVKCKQCGNDVADNAAACPKCGAPPPRRSNVGRAVLIGVGLFFSVCFLGMCSASTKAARGGGGGTASASRTSVKPATPVEIRTLLGEYRDNEIRADSSFKGHVIQTSGIVDDVKRDMLDSIYVTIGTGRQFEIPVVFCLFEDGVSS